MARGAAMVFAALAAATLVSEDLACIAAGVLVRDGTIGFVPATLACASGILAGDIGLWGVGRGGAWLAARSPRITKWLERLPRGAARQWLEQHAAATMIGSRFMPGTRLPLYVGAGISGMSLRSFASWAAVAVLLWTPAVVWAASGARHTLTAVVPGGGWPARLATIVGLVVALKAVHRAVASLGAGRFERWRRWEFWPQWVFYAPVAIWVALLALRYRGLATLTASNPAIPGGGFVGESKFDILRRLPSDATIPAALVPPGPTATRIDTVLAVARQRAWAFPLVLKPDVGQRGVGVRLARDRHDVEAYCAVEAGAILIQPYHAGPFEAGIFYYRWPGEPHGRIFSITDKRFPVVVGDGQSTVAELIQSHPRFRLQQATFLTRHRGVLNRVLAAGERFPLALAGNHAQGTMFLDGAALWTPALEQRVDAIARASPGFFIGRFDVRYADVDAFRAGADLAIVELNGATAESTAIYDPDRTLIAAYRELFRQWQLVFAIGAANRAAGVPVTSTRQLIALIGAHLRKRHGFAISA